MRQESATEKYFTGTRAFSRIVIELRADLLLNLKDPDKRFSDAISLVQLSLCNEVKSGSEDQFPSQFPGLLLGHWDEVFVKSLSEYLV